MPIERNVINISLETIRRDTWKSLNMRVWVCLRVHITMYQISYYIESMSKKKTINLGTVVVSSWPPFAILSRYRLRLLEHSVSPRMALFMRTHCFAYRMARMKFAFESASAWELILYLIDWLPFYVSAKEESDALWFDN